MSLKRKVAFADEDETDYRRARAYARLEESGDGPPVEDDSSAPPATKTKHTLDSDEEDIPDKHEKLRLDDIAGYYYRYEMQCKYKTSNICSPGSTAVLVALQLSFVYLVTILIFLHIENAIFY